MSKINVKPKFAFEKKKIIVLWYFRRNYSFHMSSQAKTGDGGERGTVCSLNVSLKESEKLTLIFPLIFLFPNQSEKKKKKKKKRKKKKKPHKF